MNAPQGRAQRHPETPDGGFCSMAGLPFCGPMILLPYLHTVNRELWSK